MFINTTFVCSLYACVCLLEAVCDDVSISTAHSAWSIRGGFSKLEQVTGLNASVDALDESVNDLEGIADVTHQNRLLFRRSS